MMIFPRTEENTRRLCLGMLLAFVKGVEGQTLATLFYGETQPVQKGYKVGGTSRITGLLCILIVK